MMPCTKVWSTVFLVLTQTDYVILTFKLNTLIWFIFIDLYSYVPIFSEIAAYDEIKYLSYNLGVDDDNVANQALAFYRVCYYFERH